MRETICLLLLVCSSFTSSFMDTKLLLHRFSDNGTKNIRPRFDQDRTMDIYVKLWLTGIMDFDVSLGRLTLTLTSFIQWVDETKVWNETEFDGLRNAWFPQNQVWMPNLFLYTLLSDNDRLMSNEESSREIYIQNNGAVSLTSTIIVDIFCEPRVKKYPFDMHECVLYVSTDRPMSQTRLVTNDFMSMDFLHNNSRWQILSWSNTVTPYYGHSFITYTVKFRRYPLFLSLNLIIPVVILAAVNPLVFILPDESGERIGFSITIFLSLIVFVSSTSDKLPDVSDPISYLNMFLVAQLFYSALVMSVVIVLSWMKHNGRSCCAVPSKCSLFCLCIKEKTTGNTKDDTKDELSCGGKRSGYQSAGNVICFIVFCGFTLLEIVLGIVFMVL